MIKSLDENLVQSTEEMASLLPANEVERALRILHLEDSQDDCDLIWRTLKKEWKDASFLRVETRAQLTTMLQEQAFDLILADYQLPHFSGLEALKIARELKPELPFIFLSGMMGEETAIDSLLQGATDYVLKDRAGRLVPAIRRALREAEARALNHELQERLLEANRLKAVGSLSTGISHDFNNILTIILGQASLLKKKGSGHPEDVLHISDIISTAARRAAAIVKQLSAFAQKEEGYAVSTNLNHRIRQALGQWGDLVPEGITIKLEAEPELPHVLMDEGHFDDILQVLLANSMESMSDTGIITISTQTMERSSLLFILNEHVHKHYVCVKFADTGRGMNADTREHIFEPFYTTKERRHGTGMGLPMVYGFMQAHDGWITVESEPARGTTMSLFFPVPEAPVKENHTVTKSLSISSRKKRTLLVIEDEADLRLILGEILESQGFEVFLAGDGDEASTLFNGQATKIELVISDIGLPGMDGITICEKLRKVNPDVKIMLSSGYPQKDYKTRINTLGIDGFLPKPYEPRELVNSVKIALESSGMQSGARWRR